MENKKDEKGKKNSLSHMIQSHCMKNRNEVLGREMKL